MGIGVVEVIRVVRGIRDIRFIGRVRTHLASMQLRAKSVATNDLMSVPHFPATIL